MDMDNPTTNKHDESSGPSKTKNNRNHRTATSHAMTATTTTTTTPTSGKKKKHGWSWIERILLLCIVVSVVFGLLYNSRVIKVDQRLASEELSDMWNSFLSDNENNKNGVVVGNFNSNGKSAKKANGKPRFWNEKNKKNQKRTRKPGGNHASFVDTLQNELDKTIQAGLEMITKAEPASPDDSGPELQTDRKQMSPEELRAQLEALKAKHRGKVMDFVQRPPRPNEQPEPSVSSISKPTESTPQQQQQQQQNTTTRDDSKKTPPVPPGLESTPVKMDSIQQQNNTTLVDTQKSPILPETIQENPLPNSTAAQPLTEERKLASEAQGQTQTKPQSSSGGGDGLNIVLFYADDWTMKVLGKLDPNVRTPNIDKMADNGALFVNNCVTTSVCWISRATLMTGTYYSRHLQSKPSVDEMFKTHDWNQTLFPKLRNAGYYTGMMGKWHAPQPRKEMEMAFDVQKAYYGDHWFTTNEFSENGEDEEIHVTDMNLRHSIKFLRDRPMDQKFALKVSFFATHAVDGEIPSYQPMNWTRFGYYPDEPGHENFTSIDPPKTATDKHWNELPYFLVSDVNCGRLRRKNRWEPHVWQKNIRDLYAMATEVDWAVGEIIQELKNQGVYEKTMLVFTTDNGDLHGEHGLAEKWFPFEESLKVPLVIQDPRMPAHQKGKFREEMTLNVDLAPTLLGAAGLEAPSFMQGRDIAELYLDENNKSSNQIQTSPLRRKIQAISNHSSPTEPWRTDWFYEWNMGNPLNASGHEQENFIDAAFALVTEEWKYILWPQKEYEQLYHRSLDPYDEYDILQNFFVYSNKKQKGMRIDDREKKRKATFFGNETTALGDSIQSTKEIYDTLKARFQELKAHIQAGNKA